jgi:hypothetical protein
MTAPGQQAGPHNEIDAVRWLTLERALDTLSYARDVKLVERAAQLS